MERTDTTRNTCEPPRAAFPPPPIIGDGLREALALLSSGVEADFGRVSEIMTDALDRLRAHELVQAADMCVDCDANTYSVLATRRAEPVSEWLLIPFGAIEVEHPVSGGSFEFTRRHADSAKRWFDGLGRKLAIDYEHQSFEHLNTRADGLRPAAGWIGRLEVRDDGLWAVDVTWTDRAKTLLAAGEYRYFSPVIYWADEDHGDVAALGPVALTNDPAMHDVTPLAASRGVQPAAINGDSEDQITLEAALLAERELDAAQEEVARLRRQLAGQEADTFVERGMRVGKILDANSMDWREDYLRDPQATAARLARAPVLLPPGRVVELDARGDVLARSDVELTYARNADAFRRAGIEVEDLTAYERAVLAGRVRRGSVSTSI